MKNSIANISKEQYWMVWIFLLKQWKVDFVFLWHFMIDPFITTVILQIIRVKRLHNFVNVYTECIKRNATV